MVKINLNHLIITFSKDLYKFHYALSLASSLKAVGKNVKIFVSGYACNFLKKNWRDYDKESIANKLEKKKMGSIEDMFTYCKELEVEICPSYLVIAAEIKVFFKL